MDKKTLSERDTCSRTSNFNLDIKNPNVQDASLGDPDELLAEYKEISTELARTRDELKKELTACVGGHE